MFFGLTTHTKDKTMKVATIALAAAFALSGTFAFAKPLRYRTNVSGGMSRMHRPSNYGNPNGTAAGPTTLSGTGSSQFGGDTPGSGGRN